MKDKVVRMTILRLRKADCRHFLAVAGRILLVLVLLSGVGCNGRETDKKKSAGSGGTALPVTVAEAVVKAMPVELTAVGAVEAFATVTVKSQVEGPVTGVHLKEGQCVAAGDRLFSIDPRPFEVQLERVEANLARDTAQLRNARTLLARNAAVVGKGYVSQEQYDQAAANVAALEATLRADTAEVKNARLQLSYCAIHAPVSGCAGQVFVDQGNLVKANDADHPLVVIRQIRPIYVNFSIPEDNLSEVRKQSAVGPLTVLAMPAGHSAQPFTGQLSFIDNSVNPGTGTILLKATFANADRALWPGQFVNTTLRLASQPQALVVPSQAVQTGQTGQYVFILKNDRTVDYRPVTVSRTIRGEAVIVKGLAPGDTVVTDGQLRLFPGAAVKILQQGSAGGPREKAS